MNAPNLDPATGVAGWNSAVADELLAKADDRYMAFRLTSAADTHIEAEPHAGTDEDFLDFLARAHEVYLGRGDYKEAHGYGVCLYRLDREDLGAPLISQSGYSLAQEEFAKASTALREEDYRRASDKGVWAAIHFGDAIRAGRREAEDEFYAAAGVALEANAYYGGPTDAIEQPIFSDCDELGIPRPVEVLMAIRVRAYEEASHREEVDIKANVMLRHAQALEDLGTPVVGMVRQSATLGIKTYLDGGSSLYPHEFIEALSEQAFPEEELNRIRLSTMQHKYALDLNEAIYNNTEPSIGGSPGRDVAIHKWFSVARDCVELIKLGDEAAKDNLIAALEKQVETISSDYFTYGDGGIEIHFDRYAEVKLITNEKNSELKQALRERLLAIRIQFLAEHDPRFVELQQEVLEEIDSTIQDFT